MGSNPNSATIRAAVLGALLDAVAELVRAALLAAEGREPEVAKAEVLYAAALVQTHAKTLLEAEMADADGGGQ